MIATLYPHQHPPYPDRVKRGERPRWSCDGTIRGCSSFAVGYEPAADAPPFRHGRVGHGRQDRQGA